MLMSGRLHRYGGWSAAQLTFPIAVMAALGVERLIVSNAAGGLHPALRVGDLVFVEDHIDWLFGTPALRLTRGVEATHASSGDRVPLGQPGRTVPLYDPELLEAALAAARQADVSAVRGTYLATLGPHYETRAEYRMMRRLGADVVGMSTVPEVVAAVRWGMRVLAVSMVSNVARPDCPSKAEHAEVLAAGADAAGPIGEIVRRLISGQP
jgi:purine-nucleoside phosphorylase